MNSNKLYKFCLLHTSKIARVMHVLQYNEKTNRKINVLFREWTHRA
jgi:hypothetical protein